MTSTPGTGAGGRPRPKVAMPKSRPSYTGPDRSYPGTSASKSPSGSRPVPSVAKSGMGSPHGGKPPGNRRATKVTPMPAPKKAQNTRSRGKPHGG